MNESHIAYSSSYLCPALFVAIDTLYDAIDSLFADTELLADPAIRPALAIPHVPDILIPFEFRFWHVVSYC